MIQSVSSMYFVISEVSGAKLIYMLFVTSNTKVHYCIYVFKFSNCKLVLYIITFFSTWRFNYIPYVIWIMCAVFPAKLYIITPITKLSFVCIITLVNLFLEFQSKFIIIMKTYCYHKCNICILWNTISGAI